MRWAQDAVRPLSSYKRETGTHTHTGRSCVKAKGETRAQLAHRNIQDVQKTARSRGRCTEQLSGGPTPPAARDGSSRLQNREGIHFWGLRHAARGAFCPISLRKLIRYLHTSFSGLAIIPGHTVLSTSRSPGAGNAEALGALLFLYKGASNH